MAKPSIDQLRHEYVTTSISIRSLADKHAVSRATICGACKREGWVSQRQKYVSSMSKKAVDKTGDKQAAHLAKITETTDLLGDKLRQLAETLNPLELDSFRDGAALMRAWKDYLSANTLVRGLMTPLEAANLDMARERLKLDQKKADVDKSQVQEVRIVMDEGVKELMI